MKNFRLYIPLCAAVLAFALVMFGLSISPRPESSHAEEVDPAAISALESCSRYAEEHGISASMYGEVEARVFGIKYLQRVHGERKVNGDDYSERAESVSAFVKAALQKSRFGGKYYVARGKFSRGKAVYPEPSELSESDYVSLYGAPPLGLIKYEFDGNILSAKKTGDNEYTFVLDPLKSTAQCAKGVKTELGSDKLPEYRSVEVVLYTDGIKPVKTVCREKLFVDKFGGVECSAVYEESFG